MILKPVTFRNKRDFNAHRLLRSIDNNTLLSKLPHSEQADEDELMLPEEKLLGLYSLFPQVIKNTQKLIGSCEILFEFGKSKNKKTYGKSKEEDRVLLRQLAEEGIKYRYKKVTQTIRQRMEMELTTIFELGFTSYFLINWDILRYARHKQYFYVGRGSGANSLVAYCLQITDVDPVELDLYFERFINPSRKNPPDFDIDFSWKDRDDITHYFFDTYGTRYTALLATYSTFQRNAVIRELGKVFGLPPAEIDRLSNIHLDPFPLDQYGKLVLRYGELIHNFPNHLSVHAGGILISEKPITYYTALQMPPKGFQITQFSMLEAEDIGLYKYDILSQRGLGHIRESIDIISENKGDQVDIHDIPAFKQDKRIKALLRTGTSIGCFYVESPAMRMLLKKLEVDDYLGLVAASSIIRPGVAKSGMMREYIQRFRYPEKRKEAHPVLAEIMPETFGVMVYQEDVIKVAHYYAGLTLEESDVMRRGMSGKFRSREEFQRVKERFFENCDLKGYAKGDVKEIWRQIESFAGYSFAKGHSASYAVESYQSLFLKAYYPLEFMVGVINNFGGFYHTEFYLHEARMWGAQLELPCVNYSMQTTCIYDKTIYIGFIHIKSLETKTIEKLMEARLQGGAFADLVDLTKRVEISLDQLRILVKIDAFRFTGLSKKELMWNAHMLLRGEKKTAPKPELFDLRPKKFKLPQLHHEMLEDAYDEMELLGYMLTIAPFDILQKQPEQELPAAELISHIGKTVQMLGYLVTIKNTSTTKGKRMQFATFIDRKGHFIDTVHFPPIAARYPFRGKGCYYIKGKVMEEFDVLSVEVSEMEKIGYQVVPE